MTEHQCACGKPAPDATVCTSCETRLAVALGDVPALVDELDTTLARQGRGGKGVGYVHSSPTRPLPYDPKASDAAGHLKAVLVSWVRLVQEDRDGFEQAADPRRAQHLKMRDGGNVNACRDAEDDPSLSASEREAS
jgi:hypothetical protein